MQAFAISPTVHTNSSFPASLNSLNLQFECGFLASVLTDSRDAALNSRGQRRDQDPGGTKSWSTSTPIVVGSRTADTMQGRVDKACNRRWKTEKLHHEVWEGRVEPSRVRISRLTEITRICSVTVSHLPTPDSGYRSHGSGELSRRWIGWTPLVKTERSGV